MSIQTTIPYVDSSVNPATGCDGCELWSKTHRVCYAGTMTETNQGPGSFDVVTPMPGRMATAAKWAPLQGKGRQNKPWIPQTYPRIIFISDFTDILSKDITFEYLYDEVIENVRSEHGRKHQWIWFTKRPARMVEFFKWMGGALWPENLWPGTSVTRNSAVKRLEILNEIPADVLVASLEPMYEFVNLPKSMMKNRKWWVIVGGPSGVGAKPMPVDGATMIFADARAIEQPFFMKQFGGHPDRQEDMSKFPKGLQIREFPKTSFTEGTK